MRTGIIIARLQPVHNGHLALIDKAIQENDEVIVYIGSANKFNARNPLPIHLRQQLLTDAILERYGKENQKCAIRIAALDDLTDETDNSHDWGFYLYSKIVTDTKNPNFTIYYSDGFEIITTWFPAFLLRNNVSLSLLARNATEAGISATQVREMIMNDSEDLYKYVPKSVLNARETIKAHIELSKLIK